MAGWERAILEPDGQAPRPTQHLAHVGVGLEHDELDRDVVGIPEVEVMTPLAPAPIGGHSPLPQPPLPVVQARHVRDREAHVVETGAELAERFGRAAVVAREDQGSQRVTADRQGAVGVARVQHGQSEGARIELPRRRHVADRECHVGEARDAHPSGWAAGLRRATVRLISLSAVGAHVRHEVRSARRGGARGRGRGAARRAGRGAPGAGGAARAPGEGRAARAPGECAWKHRGRA